MSLNAILAGRDGPNRRALPAGEFLHPVPLAALLILVANDWWFKGSGWMPSLITGKLSDFAGLLFFPLLLTAMFDSAALGLHRLGLHRTGRPLDFTLRRYKLAIAIASTALVFALIKVSPSCNELMIESLAGVGIPARIVLDPTDLFALPILYASWRLGCAEIAQVPLGRLEYIQASHSRTGVGVGTLLDDTLRLNAQPQRVQELIEAFNQYLREGNTANSAHLSRCLALVRDLALLAR